MTPLSGSAAFSARTSPSPAGPVPARAYIDTLLPGVLDGRAQPGKVFDREIALDVVPDGYRAMDAREAVKVRVSP
jgi:threonine dehydrogenase-like Zn-dependent dehydrogenase